MRDGGKPSLIPGLSAEKMNLLKVLVLLVEMDLSEKELHHLLGRVKDIYPKVRVVPPGWDG